MQEGENKFRQTGKRQLGHEGSGTELDNAKGAGSEGEKRSEERRWFSDEIRGRRSELIRNLAA